MHEENDEDDDELDNRRAEEENEVVHDAVRRRDAAIHHADDLAQRNQVRRARQAIPPHLATVRMQESGLTQVGQDQLEELARHIRLGRDPVHRDRRATLGLLCQEKHCAKRISGTLRQHAILMPILCGGGKAAIAFSLFHIDLEYHFLQLYLFRLKNLEK